MPIELNRRNFLGLSLAGSLTPISGWAANDKINLGLIGAGARGNQVLNGFLELPEVQVSAVCDVDRFHYREHTSRKGNPYGLDPTKMRIDKKYGDDGCATYTDYRELIARDDIDAVIVATPDHWHAKIALEAIEAGKDVYCEKPVTHTFAQGYALHQAVAETGAVFQVGSQQRSMTNCRQAVDWVRSGVLGKLSKVKVGLPPGYAEAMGSTEIETPPENLDYAAWCGEAPQLPYMRARHHRWWRGHSAYGGGTMMDFIGHHNDIAMWGAGFEKSGPTSVRATKWTREKARDIYDTPVDYTIQCEYPGGLEWVIDSQFDSGMKWIGENGWIYATREKNTVSENLKNDLEDTITDSMRHDQNFIDCIRSRKECIAPAEVGHRSITPGHLAKISVMLGSRELKWDAEKEQVVGDGEAQKLLMA